MISTSELERIQEIVNPLRTKKVWHVSSEKLEELILDIGEISLVEDGIGTEDWELRVLGCAWRIQTDQEVLVSSSDRTPARLAAIKFLEGQIITDIQITRPAFDTLLSFDNGIALRLFPVFMDKYFHWILFTPDSQVLVIGPGSKWGYEALPSG